MNASLKPQFNFQINVVTLIVFVVTAGMVWQKSQSDSEAFRKEFGALVARLDADREDTKARRAYVDAKLALADETRLKADQSRLDVAAILKALDTGRDDRLRSQREQDQSLNDIRRQQAVSDANQERIAQDVRALVEAARRSGNIPFDQKWMRTDHRSRSILRAIYRRPRDVVQILRGGSRAVRLFPETVVLRRS